jgi:hypothetical protein
LTVRSAGLPQEGLARSQGPVVDLGVDLGVAPMKELELRHPIAP